jgi:hypothetical protein
MTGEQTDYWAFFTKEALRTGSLLYSRLAAGVRDDERMKALAARVRRGQPHANVLFAAVHFLLLRGAKHPLRKFYPTLGGSPANEDDDPYPLFGDFVTAHESEVTDLIETRVTNTNEIGRCAVLHPAFRVVAAEIGEPLSLVEIGPSAGLNLTFDRYGVRYSRGGSVAASIDGAFSLECELKGEKMPPTGAMPRVARRLGLELNPVDLSNADDRDWLRALVWPEDLPRHALLNRAIELYRPGDVEIRGGDALDLLPEALAEVPPDHVACVFHTIAVYQFSSEMKNALDNILIAASLRREVVRVGLEMAGPEYLVTLMRYRDGVSSERVLASSHPHGRWLEWR